MAKSSKKGTAEVEEGFPIGNPPTESTKPASTVLITPSIGRIVLFRDGFSDQPCAAQIAYVHDDYTINIGYIDRSGLPQSKLNVPLIQVADVGCEIGQCMWMDYQVDQASK